MFEFHAATGLSSTQELGSTLLQCNLHGCLNWGFTNETHCPLTGSLDADGKRLAESLAPVLHMVFQNLKGTYKCSIHLSKCMPLVSQED